MISETTSRVPDDAANPPRNRVLVVFSGLMLVILLASLDATIVSTALPTIVGDLGGLNHLSWVVTAYLLAQTVVTPLYGKLGDLYGRKVTLQAGLIVFLIGSALCGLSQNLPELIAFRAVQGVGGGGLIVSAQAAIGDVVSPRERGRYVGIFGAVFGLSSIAGPLLGGFFTTNLSWRWIFYINIPLGVLALIVLGATLPSAGERAQHTIDYLGTLLFAGGLSAIVLLTSLGGNTYAWSSPEIIGLGIAAVVLLALFVAVERGAAEPVLPLRLFRNSVFVTTGAIGLIVGFALFGSVTYLPLFLQVVNGVSPTESGLQLLPLIVGLLLTSIGSGQIISRTGRYKVFPILGTAIMVIGLYLLSLMNATTSVVTASLYMFVLGLGLGMVMQVLVLAVQNAVPYSDLGVATSGATLFRSIGGSLGVSLLGTIFASRLSTELAGTGAAVRNLGSETVNPAALKRLPAPVHEAFVHAFTNALSTVFLVASGITLAGFAVSWLLKELPLRETVATAGVGEAFAVPKTTDSRRELLRGITAIVGRETVREAIERIAQRAGVDLGATECWLLGRISESPDLDLNELATTRDVPLARLEPALGVLRERGLVSGDAFDASLELTPAGLDIHERLVQARGDYLSDLLAGWSPERDAELRGLVTRLAQELAREAPAARPAATDA
ncbi:MAG TPA: MFS transporter [Gaiellales bacterium]|nr:MFS transporter [Gaiellales bacterium]